MQFPLVSACKVKNTAGRAGNRCFRTPRTTDFKAEYKKVIRLVFPSEFPKLYSASLFFSFFFRVRASKFNFFLQLDDVPRKSDHVVFP
jgi:hypothetical protein